MNETHLVRIYYGIVATEARIYSIFLTGVNSNIVS